MENLILFLLPGLRQRRTDRNVCPTLKRDRQESLSHTVYDCDRLQDRARVRLLAARASSRARGIASTARAICGSLSLITWRAAIDP
jgi:hypothetical protein